MKSPSHYILNLAILGKPASPDLNIPITIGALIPDLPIYIFYFVAKFIYRMPESKIWSEAYYEPFWHNSTALFHSIPLAGIGLLVAYGTKWKWGVFLFASMILHSLLDLPVHNDDAHRHFYPFSQYRFISPFSYWDTNHYGRIVSLVELLLVLGVTPWVFHLLQSWVSKGLLIGVNLLYALTYLRFFVL